MRVRTPTEAAKIVVFRFSSSMLTAGAAAAAGIASVACVGGVSSGAAVAPDWPRLRVQRNRSTTVFVIPLTVSLIIEVVCRICDFGATTVPVGPDFGAGRANFGLSSMTVGAVGEGPIARFR